MTSARTALGIAVALVRHLVVERVGPNRHAAQRGSDGSVVHKELIGHHFELLVSSDAEVRSPHSDDGAVCNIGETLHDQSGAGHLGQPIVVRSLRPVFRVVPVSHGENPDLVSPAVELLNRGVIRVFVRNVERSLQRASVGILPLPVENGPVQVDVVAVDGAVEGDGDHLGHLSRVNISWHSGSVRGTEAIRQLTLGKVAIRCPVRVFVDGAGVFIRTVRTIRLLITEEFLIDAFAVAALQLGVRANRFIGDQIGQNPAGL